MRVCHCTDVSDREITSLAREGVTDVEAIGRFCRAGTQCGGCRPEIARLICAEVAVDVCSTRSARSVEPVSVGDRA